ncbi:E3 ubiquitin-protein ligase Topors-like isoform X2 [Periplaneta americana]|uniref:E3 ubiquitin-protein ligase Topors-like isoform X2 n=1 Tax=Periplaneta americana TaxID=6978 RepID=UPI0037E79463
MWIWRRMERVKWTERIRNEAVLERVSEERMMLKLIRKRKRNWLGHWLRRNCLLKDALEGTVNRRRVQIYIMEPVRCPTPPLAAVAGPSPKSPLEDRPPSPRNNLPEESEKSVTPTNDRTASPEPNCAICLGKSQNKSFTDSCLHQFCFNCLLEWSKVKPECPLCKQSFKSIIHNVRSNEDYDQYHLRPASENPYPWVNMINIDMVQQRFRYRSTLTPDRRLERALEHLEQDLQRRVEPGDVIPPQRTWRRRRGLAPDDFRVNVYNQNLWVTSLPCMGMSRDVSPQNFRSHPEEVHRLIPWLNRELQAILRSPGLSARVLDLVITQLPRHHMQSPEFRFQLGHYLREHYDHFIHEFYTFARSPYDMIGFDENANYSNDRPSQHTSLTYSYFGLSPSQGTMVEVVHEVSSDSSDSDVMVLPPEETQAPSGSHSRRNASASHGPNSPVAGPSRAVLPVDQASDSDANNMSSSHSDVSVPSGMQDSTTLNDNTGAQPSQSNDVFNSDECMIVGYVKPRHERTPEVITLLSSDPEVEEEVTELPQMTCTGCYDRSYGYAFSTSTSSPESSGSEYNPSASYKTKKKVQHKGKSTTATKGRSSRKTTKTAATTKRQTHNKSQYFSSDSDSSVCSCNGKKSTRKIYTNKASSSNRRARSRKVRSPSMSSTDSNESMVYCSSSSVRSSSSSRSSHTWRKSKPPSRKEKKGSWRIQINVPDMKQEQDYNSMDYDPPYTSTEISNFLGNSASTSRPKLRSIVITRATNGEGRHRESSGGSSHDRGKLNKDEQHKSVAKKSKSHRENGSAKKVKDEESAGPSTHHRGSSHSSSHSSHRHESSSRHLGKSNKNTRRKHSKKDEKKSKRRKESESSMERKSRGSKSKKRKRILSLFSDSSDN